MRFIHSILGAGIGIAMLSACGNAGTSANGKKQEQTTPKLIYKSASEGVEFDNGLPVLKANEYAEYTLEVEETGRYRINVIGTAAGNATLWIEDYVHNTDDRIYDITGKLSVKAPNNRTSVDGSPLQKGTHEIRIHVSYGTFRPDTLTLELLRAYSSTPDTLVQAMKGKAKKLVWSDEFDSPGLPDESKWLYNIGNWGWGNNELQYYTSKSAKNARVENGNLIIEAHKDYLGAGWTSARITTQGKTTFLYGALEIRAKVPEGRGTWAAGWMLGDTYRDEISWPYCGEIDVLECVGYEINDTTGSGRNHATCHTPAYYFKIGNQISAQMNLDSMNTKYHIYAMEWYPDSIRCLLDGEHYYTYDKNANELEWPFNQPQNIILNLAVGGGWGGAKGVDSSYVNHQFIIDYVRWYEYE